MRGHTVLQVVQGMPDAAEDEARELLAEMGIDDPEPDAWYPTRAWVDTTETIGDRIGNATVQQIGATVVGTVEWPAGTDGFRDGVAVLDRAYRADHRGEEVGGYSCRPGEGDATLVIRRTDHPAGFDEAVIRATASAFPSERVPRVAEVSDEFDDADGHVFRVSWCLGV